MSAAQNKYLRFPKTQLPNLQNTENRNGVFMSSKAKDYISDGPTFQVARILIHTMLKLPEGTSNPNMSLPKHSGEDI